jgi:hypothetical protein
VNEEEREHIGIADGVGIRPMNAPVNPGNMSTAVQRPLPAQRAARQYYAD